jgi:chromosome segregation ATPase
MTDWNRNESPYMTRALDCLFSQLGGNPYPDADPTAPAESAAPPAASLAETTPPPKVETQADLQAAYEWLLRERQRLDGYTNSQLARLQGEHQAMLTRHYTNEQVLILRAQELTNKEEFLTRQTRGLQEQAAQLAEREKALADQREALCKTHEEYAVVQESCTGVKRDAAMQHALLETLRAETEAVRQDREKARQDLDAMEQRLLDQREARAREQTLFAERQTELEQRLGALEQAEKAAQRRLAELDDLEARLRQEIEEREHELVGERQALDELAELLRQQPPIDAGYPALELAEKMVSHPLGVSTVYRNGHGRH